MKYLALIGAFCIGLILAPLAAAQQEIYRPPLGDIMGTIQARHIKLWLAGKLENWDLAIYEVGKSGRASRTRRVFIGVFRQSS